MDNLAQYQRSPWSQKLRNAVGAVLWHAQKHVGVGIICAVAYFDPGNWAVDLQAGSQFGYRLLFVVLLAGLLAVVLQVLATRLGCVTGIDLATHCRLMLYDRPKYPRLMRWLLLYPLYLLSEAAIIATDLAELLGSAIALCLLFPKLRLWSGVLITAFDVLVILAFGDPLHSKPLRYFEFLIAFLVLAVMVCITIIISKLHVEWEDAFLGFVPSKYIFQSGGVYTSIGILGATVMPHSLFLGSNLATQNRLASEPSEIFDSITIESVDSPLPRRLFISAKSFLRESFRMQRSDHQKPRRYSDRENNTLAFVRAHLHHGIVDIAGSLLGFAVLINAMILIVAGAVFFYGPRSGSQASSSVSLFDAHALIADIVGRPAAVLFALALLSAGQSASLIATIAGQAVSEGFLNWRISPMFRRLITRVMSLIPAMTVALVVGRPGINVLLVASQVVLSIVLPFITFPLIYLTSCKSVMSVKKPASTLPDGGTEQEVVDYSNGKIITGLAWAIWLVIFSANMYVIVTLALGKGG